MSSTTRPECVCMLFRLLFESYSDFGTNSGGDLVIRLALAENELACEEIGSVRIFTANNNKPGSIVCIHSNGREASNQGFAHWVAGPPSGDQLAISGVNNGHKAQISEKKAELTEKKQIVKPPFFYLHSTAPTACDAPALGDGCYWYRLQIPATIIERFRKAMDVDKAKQLHLGMVFRVHAKKAPNGLDTKGKTLRELPVPLFNDAAIDVEVAGAPGQLTPKQSPAKSRKPKTPKKEPSVSSAAAAGSVCDQPAPSSASNQQQAAQSVAAPSAPFGYSPAASAGIPSLPPTPFNGSVFDAPAHAPASLHAALPSSPLAQQLGFSSDLPSSHIDLSRFEGDLFNASHSSSTRLFAGDDNDFDMVHAPDLQLPSLAQASLMQDLQLVPPLNAGSSVAASADFSVLTFQEQQRQQLGDAPIAARSQLLPSCGSPLTAPPDDGAAALMDTTADRVNHKRRAELPVPEEKAAAAGDYKEAAQQYWHVLKEQGLFVQSVSLLRDPGPTSFGVADSQQNAEVNSTYTKQLVFNAVYAYWKAGHSLANTERHLTLEGFLACFSESGWSTQLSATHIKKLYGLVAYSDSGDGRQITNSKLDIMDLIHCFLWLGDAGLTPQQAIPAHMAIDFLDHFITTNTQARSMYRGFFPRTKIDSRNQGALNKGEKLLRLNEGRLQLDRESKEYFHRNMVFTDTADAEMPHRLLWAFDTEKRVIIEATEPVRQRYRRRTASPSANFTASFSVSLRAFTAQHSSQPQAFETLADSLGAPSGASSSTAQGWASPVVATPKTPGSPAFSFASPASPHRPAGAGQLLATMQLGPSIAGSGPMMLSPQHRAASIVRS